MIKSEPPLATNSKNRTIGPDQHIAQMSIYLFVTVAESRAPEMTNSILFA